MKCEDETHFKQVLEEAGRCGGEGENHIGPEKQVTQALRKCDVE